MKGLGYDMKFVEEKKGEYEKRLLVLDDREWYHENIKGKQQTLQKWKIMSLV